MAEPKFKFKQKLQLRKDAEFDITIDGIHPAGSIGHNENGYNITFNGISLIVPESKLSLICEEIPQPEPEEEEDFHDDESHDENDTVNAYKDLPNKDAVKAELTARGITFEPNAKRAELEALLIQADKGGEG